MVKPIDLPEYIPAAWLPNGHFQTVYASLFMPIPRPPYQREILDLPDGDITAADWIAGEADKPLLVLIHGMEGDSDSNYARLLMNQCRSLGWRGVVLHMRSCGGFMNRKPTFYHAGYYQDIEYFLDQLLPTRFPEEKVFLCGISLGGSQVAHYLAKGRAVDQVRAAAIVSTPLDLRGSADFMSGGLNRLYVLKFRNSLLRKYRAKADLIKNPHMENQLARARTFWDLDNAATAPMHGFRDAAHYYSEMSACNVLKDIQVPTVYIASRDDPFIPEASMPSTGMHFENLQSYLTQRGGHAGFIDQHHRSWMVKAVFTYFNNVESPDSRMRKEV
jgi:predicted alpha/beta-fold hydrolase